MRLLMVFCCLSLLHCCSNYFLPSYCPANGTVIQKIKWQLPLEDSSNVLIKQNDEWILPQLLDTIETQTSSFRAPELTQYSQYLGRVNQEVIHSTQPAAVEFYRFEKGNVLFLGFTTPDSIKPLIMFDPPLVVMPDNIFDLDETHESVTTMKTLNKTSGEFIKGDKTKLTLRKLDSGFIKSLHSSACLLEMKITSDKTIQFGESGLIVPEATLMKSKILIGEQGTLLEWEVKSKPRRQASEDNEITKENLDEEPTSGNDHPGESDFYLEVARIIYNNFGAGK